MKEYPRLKSWFSVVLHVHTKLDHLLPSSEQELENLTHESNVPLSSLLERARVFFNDSEILICDTDHPIHVLDRKGVSRKEAFTSNKISETIEIISQGVTERSRLVSSLGKNIITGVEADILNSDGLLDVNDESLRQLDLVIASFHYNYWKMANEGKKPTGYDYIASLIGAASNPHVDILGHPIRELQPIHLEEIRINDFDELFCLMRDREVAYELNLQDYILNDKSKKTDFERDLIQRAANLGVLFVIGLDFHNFNDYQIYNESGGLNLKLFRRLWQIMTQFYHLGVDENNLINRNPELFLKWIKERNGK